MSSSELFRVNVRRLAAARQIHDLDALASALAWQGEDKRWLRRLWNEGLSRPDPRRAKQLRHLATFLMQANVRELWNPQAGVKPLELMENRQDWAAIVSQIIHFFQTLQQAKLRRSEPVREMLAKYGFNEEFLIADCVAAFFGRSGVESTDIDTTPFYAVADDLRSEWEFANWVLSHRKQGLREFVVERASDHPNWKSFVDRLRTFCAKTYGVDEDADGLIDFTLDEMLNQMRLRPLSPQEILDQFIAFYLEESPQKEAVTEGLPYILAQLQSHSQWSNWVELVCKGDEEKAKDRIGGMWQRAIEEVGDRTIAPESFVAYMYQHLNSLEVTR